MIADIPIPFGPSLDLVTLARRIQASHRRGEACTLRALEHFRQAGEWLMQVKDRLEYGAFKQWIEAHCRFSYRTACHYMEVCRRWQEIEELVASKVQRVAPLGLGEVLKSLARPRLEPGDDGRTTSLAIPFSEHDQGSPGRSRGSRREPGQRGGVDRIGHDRRRDFRGNRLRA